MSPPLKGIRVLELGIFQVGPSAACILGDMGAEVIKIEPPGGDLQRHLVQLYTPSLGLPNGSNMYFETLNRNKKSIALDLTKESAREVVYRLVRTADVFIQNYRRGVAERLGVDYATLSRHNPRLVYASATGYGPRGEDSYRPGIDPIGQARSGLMMAVGEPDMPPVFVREGLVDQTTSITMVYGILAALLERERTGEGQEVNVSLLGSVMSLMVLNFAVALMRGRELPRIPRRAARNPLFNYYRCADGKWLMLALFDANRFWPDFCRLVGLEELENDPRFKDFESRAEHCEELIEILDRLFASRPREEWLEILGRHPDFVFSPVNTVTEAAQDPQARANDYVVEFDHPELGRIRMPGFPVTFGRTPCALRSRAPKLGEHTEEVLRELGYSEGEILKLRREGAI